MIRMQLLLFQYINWLILYVFRKRPNDVSIEDAIRMLRTLVTAYHAFGANTTQATNDLEELFALNNITVEDAMDTVSVQPK